MLLDLLGFDGIGPETGLGRGPLEKGYFFLLAREVKDTPIGARRVPSSSKLLPWPAPVRSRQNRQKGEECHPADPPVAFSGGLDVISAMSRPPPCLPVLLILLAPLGPAAADSEAYDPDDPYVVETSEGGIFSSRITGSDEDSLYFQDGSALARSEVESIRKKGAWSVEQTVHPGPETGTREGSTLVIERTPLVNFATLVVEVLEAIFGRN